MVELTDVGRRYIRSGDAARPFDVAPARPSGCAASCARST